MLAEEHQEKREALFTALRDVYDPELGLNVVELGLIRNVEFDDEAGEVTITMILTTPFCPYAPALIERVQMRAQETLEMPTKVELGMEMWDPSMMEEEAAARLGIW
ncbi:MAG TPA: metal-sulfur cluster assembly factor [Chloroflexi bacterium]|nr:metal-sulfur cluster assembly factor [Chloroflexota bacterium]